MSYVSSQLLHHLKINSLPMLKGLQCNIYVEHRDAPAQSTLRRPSFH